jgi:hypothetical protein
VAGKIQRGLLSLVILAHIVAVGLWNLPDCALRKRLGGWAPFYMMPTGQWQHWGMFAPEPFRETVMLEAQARDARGDYHIHTFPRMADKPFHVAFLGYRHSKFMHNMALEDNVAQREFAARHAVRSWNLPAEAFPVELDLYYKAWRPAALGDPPHEEARAPEIQMLQAYKFPTIEDVQP